MVLRKFEIEEALREENQEISAGRLKEDSPLDFSEGFKELCEAARRGDLKTIHEKIAGGVNINARDAFDNTPLILVYPPPRLIDCLWTWTSPTDGEAAHSIIIPKLDSRAFPRMRFLSMNSRSFA
jgi:hypothetical protein